MPVHYECDICGADMVGWRSISLMIPGAIQYNDSEYLFNASACFDCRHAIADLARNELLFRPVYLDFLRKAKRRLSEFKKEVT